MSKTRARTAAVMRPREITRELRSATWHHDLNTLDAAIGGKCWRDIDVRKAPDGLNLVADYFCRAGKITGDRRFWDALGLLGDIDVLAGDHEAKLDALEEKLIPLPACLTITAVQACPCDPKVSLEDAFERVAVTLRIKGQSFDAATQWLKRQWYKYEPLWRHFGRTSLMPKRGDPAYSRILRERVLRKLKRARVRVAIKARYFA